MSWVKDFSEAGLSRSLDFLEAQVDGLRQDIEELFKNRKYTLSEALAVRLAYDVVADWERILKLFYLSQKADELPEHIQERIAIIFKKLEALNGFIVDNFRDCFDEPDKFKVAI